MVQINTKTEAKTWLETILDETTDGDRRNKAKTLLDDDLNKDSNIEKVRQLVAQEYHVDVH